MASDPPPTEVLPWLKSLPLAPEYRPTIAEFHDPIAYILKIEKEAAAFGICKIVPPLPAAPKKAAAAHLNRSFAARDPNPKKPPTFTTRQQQIGFCPRRPRPVQKPVWQSGEHYTLQQFEAKAKQFERSQLKKAGKKALSLLEIETLFWRACADKPFTVEYANDIPGSGFGPLGSTGKRWRDEEPGNVGETAWNMRGVSRAKGSLLRFMKEEIPGVTSPMVYVAMMFSWFAWHAEDHELHSLNYLHMGAGKTWYGVPRDARLAFEEVVRVQGYSGEVNPLVTFAILGEKTTVMSPEVLIDAGIPCCRLVQEAGEFVVTFPGAYHCGFSHGFNCGEASNIATPEWLRFAKDAAIRRASTNYPPMVSHFQLLYALALSLRSRVPMSGGTEPRSSRLKDKMRGEGEVMTKTMFVQNVMENNDLLSILVDKGSSCIVLPHNTSGSPLCSSALVRSQIKVKPRLSFGLCSRQEALEASMILPSDDTMIGRNAGIRHLNGFGSLEGDSVSVLQRRKPTSATCGKFETADLYSSTSDSKNVEGERESTQEGDGLLDQGLLSCVTCGILSFACVAIIQPKEAATRYLMSADCRFLGEQITGPGEISDNYNDTNSKTSNYNMDFSSGQKEQHVQDRVDCNLIHSGNHSVEGGSDTGTQKVISALDLLASAYGDSSDSEGEEVPHEMIVCTDENDLKNSFSSSNAYNEPTFAIKTQNIGFIKVPNEAECQIEVPGQYSYCTASDDLNGLRSVSVENRCHLKLELSGGSYPEIPISIEPDNSEDDRKMPASSSLMKSKGEPRDFSCSELDNCHHASGTAITHQGDIPDSCCDAAGPTGNAAITVQLTNFHTKITSSTISAMKRSDRDYSRMHVFCLEHAVEVEKLLHPIGGVHIMLLCHPDYPKIETEAKLFAKELGIDYIWKDINFREATGEDQERVRAASEDEEAVPMNSDWAVKLGINLYYSVSLSKSPLYSKQMPYNAIVYKAFGRSSPNNSPVKSKASRRRPGRQKKIVVAGKWCGKVWMSNQVHPYLAPRNDGEERERAERLHPRATDQKSKVGTETESAYQETPHENNSPRKIITYARKFGKRKKKPLVKASTKKPRHAKPEDSLKPTEDEAEISSAQCGMVLRSSRNDHGESRRRLTLEDETEGGPSTRLRRRPPKSEKAKPTAGTKKRAPNVKAKKTKDEESEYGCDIDGCSMSFTTKQDLALHKRDICPVKGCGKKFFSHKYLVQHRKVHVDDRPLECPWKGCKMTFKWPWARTEHIRVHTGDRPYVCMDGGCGQTFRFVSDFSRHKRKTGHSVRKGRR